MITDFAPGQVVVSKSGRDKGYYFIVVHTEGKFVYVVDGDLRKMEKPKKKNPLHLKAIHVVFGEVAEKLKSGETIRNADIRKMLSTLDASSGKCGHLGG